MKHDRRAWSMRQRQDAEQLAALSVEESIALGEALLVSDAMRLAQFDPTPPRPVSLAVRLRHRRAERT